MPLALSVSSALLALSLSLTVPDFQQAQSKSESPTGGRVQALALSLERATTESEQDQLLESEKDLINRSLLTALRELIEARLRKPDYPTATRLCRLAIRLGERIGDQEAVGDAWCQLGNINNRQNRNSEALECFKKTIAVAEVTGDKRLKLRALHGIGIAYSGQRRFDLAQGYYEQGLALSEELGERRVMAGILNNLGNAYTVQGHNALGLEFLRRSLAISEEVDDKVTLEQALNNIGTHYLEQGRYADALEYLQRSLKILESIGTQADEAGLAIKLQNIGLVYRRQGRADQALEYYFKSLKLMEARGDKFGVANLQNNIGVAYKSQGLYERSLEWFQKSSKLFDELKAKAGVARCMNNIGDAYRLLGRYETALEYLQKSLQLREEINDAGASSLTLINMGRLYRTEGRHSESLEVSRRAAATAERLNDPETLWNAQELIGNALLARGQQGEARRYFLDAIDTIERLRNEVAGGQQQQSFLENRLGPWLGMVALLVSQKEYSQALGFAERSKARVLLDTLQGGRANLRGSLSQKEGEAEETARLRLVELNSQLTNLARRDKPDQPALAELRSTLGKARLEYEALETSLYAAHPELRVRRGEASIITTEELSALLPDAATALLEYVVAEDRTYLFAVTRAVNTASAQVQVFTIPVRRDELAKQTEIFRVQLAARDLGFATSAHKLYDLVLKPAEEALRGKSNIVISPDDKLWELPFQALVARDGKYTIERSAISYVPSLTVLREMKLHRGKDDPARRNPTSTYPLLAFGNPDVGKETIERAKLTVNDEKLKPLPEAEKEARALGQLYGARLSKVYVGAEAREDRFKAEAPQARVLHFATHGILNNTYPMYSHLALSQGTKSEDGLLEAWELMQMDLKADLAVLSACETARGRFGAGEGMIGLTWAMFLAGVPATLVTQWKVESASTRELMINFHRQSQALALSSGSRWTKAEALQHAALRVMKNPQTRHPFYWAGFVLVGDAR